MSNNKQIPAAQELFDKMIEVNDECTSTEMMIEFAKLHVTAALKAAADDYSEGPSDIVQECIINAYPFSNIQ